VHTFLPSTALKRYDWEQPVNKQRITKVRLFIRVMVCLLMVIKRRSPWCFSSLQDAKLLQAFKFFHQVCQRSAQFVG
jgi:hypothetical protein